jgi:hypothetical protein
MTSLAPFAKTKIHVLMDQTASHDYLHYATLTATALVSFGDINVTTQMSGFFSSYF